MLPRSVRRAARSDNDMTVVILLLGVVVVLLAGGGGVVFWGMRRAQVERARAMDAELRAMEAEEQARAEAEKAGRPKEQKVDDLLHPRRQHPAEEALRRGQALCGKGQVNEGLLWFARGLEQSGDHPALQRVFRANLAAWDDTRGERKLLAQKGAVTALAISPDGKLVLTGGDDGAARAWQADGGQPAGETMPGGGKVTALGFGAGGKEWLVANDAGSRRFDAATRKPLEDAVEPPGTVLAIGAKGDQVMMFGTCEQGTWLAPDGGQDDVKKLFHAESAVTAAGLGPDVRLILTGHEDHLAHAWDARGKPVGNPLPHETAVGAVAVSGDGKWFATGAGQTAQLWDADTHLPVGRPLAHEGDVTALAFTPDGSALVSGDRRGTVRRWEVPAPMEADAVRLRLWVEVRAAKVLDGAGNARPLDDKAVQERRQKLQAAGGPPRP